MNSAIYSGLWGKSSDLHINPLCSSSSCEWPEYTSLAVCSQCSDMSSLALQTCGVDNITSVDADNQTITETRQYCNYTLPNGLMLAGNENFNMNITGSNSTVAGFESFGSINNTFSVLSIMRGNWNNSEPRQLQGVDVQQCAFYMCVKKYTAKVVNSTLQETIISTFQDAPKRERIDEDLILQPDAHFLNGTQGRLQGVFAIEGKAYNAFIAQLNNFWYGNTTAFGGYSSFSSSDVARLLWTYGNADVASRMGDLAISMTTAMRNAGDMYNISGSQGVNETSPLEYIVGTTYIEVPFVVVQWLWIILPIGMLFLTLLLTVLTITVSRRDGGSVLWKGQSLASFYQPLTNDGRAELRQAKNMKELEEIAERLTVKWAPTEKGWRLAKERDA